MNRGNALKCDKYFLVCSILISVLGDSAVKGENIRKMAEKKFRGSPFGTQTAR